MKDTSYRTFEITRGKGRSPLKFAVHTSADGSVQVTRISPYDETEYHWASKSSDRKHWRIIRKGHTVSTISPFIGNKPSEIDEPLSPEQIVYFLIKADTDAHLEPRLCHD